MTFVQQWPDEVMRRALRLRRRGLSYIRISQRLAETMDRAPRWDLIRDWHNGRVKCAGKAMSKLVWRESGHLSDPDAGHALCGAAVRFQVEVPAVGQGDACAACVLRAESAGREFVAPVRSERVARGQLALEAGT